MKDKVTAALLAFFLGSIGVHRFYLGQTGIGFLCLIFCWTLIPALIAFIDFIIFLTMSQQSFDLKYNRAYLPNQVAHPYGSIVPVPQKDKIAEIERLHNLRERGILTDAEFEEAKKRLL
ncbi:NINE protein [Sphingobacterium oryzagri]|uniref:NINE protein n=1 Tax=Sphingobacterium oryzagri TaxID=3025669 RepID=A0ABY7WDD1_9SPHI|nr:NINE protein [Sphingobacterium sp. KACC 22765]WDF67666.1 NINE protein [Sphingobacterium sp. KACC 22765]